MENPPPPPPVGRNTTSENKRPPLWRSCLLLSVPGLVLLLLYGTHCGKIVEDGDPRDRKQRARRVMATVIFQAIEQFYSDYGRLPVPPGMENAREDLLTDTSARAGLVGVLLAREAGSAPQNTRQTDYFDGFPEARPAKSGGSPTFGLESRTGSFAIWDPWGRPFHVLLDTSDDNELKNPNADEGQPERLLRKRVLIWSDGPDGDESTWDDNVMSWQ